MGPGGSRGLQNRRDPTSSGRVGSIPIHSRHAFLQSSVSLRSIIRRGARRATLLGLALPAVATAQRADSARAAVVPRPAAVVDTARSTNARSPLSPRRAFLYSLAAPGYGQTVLGRPTAAAIFVFAEALAAVMIFESSASLREARRLTRDSLVYVRSEPDGKPIFAPAPFPPTLVRSRQAQVEDWIAVLVANHLFAGADAFVAAHLWDVPIRIAPRPASRSMHVGTRFPW